jgi:hypothetical protein
MHLLRTFTYCFITCFLLLSCNNASDSHTTSEAAEFRRLENLDVNAESEYKDPYWDNPAVGADPTEKTNLVKKFNNLLVFHIDDTMEVKTVYTATLALARNAAIGPLKIKVLEESGASGDDVLLDTTIELGKRMKANLKDMSPSDNKSFKIEPFGTDEQNLNKSKESYWQWSIEPLKEGSHKLMLSIQVILSDEDKVNLPARNIPVMIYSKKVPFMSKVGNFFSNYWQWLITAILLPIIIALLTNSLKQRGEKKKQKV